MSVPPNCVSPEVDLTSKTPSEKSITVTSNVPPPKSKTRTPEIIFLPSSLPPHFQLKLTSSVSKLLKDLE